MNGAERLVRSLLASGVDTCFANPGTSEIHFIRGARQGRRARVRAQYLPHAFTASRIRWYLTPTEIPWCACWASVEYGGRSMNQDKIREVSNALAAAWRGGGSVNISENLWPTSLEESMAIQDALDAKINEEIAAWKIAVTDPSHFVGSRPDQEKQPSESETTSLPPGFYGRYYESVTQKSPGHFRMSDFRNQPQLEAEFALRLGQELPSRDTPYGMEEVEDAIEAVVMTIDVADTRWYWDPSDWPTPALLDIYKGAADLANGGALVIGDEIPGWRDLDLAEVPVAIYFDGNPVASRIRGQTFREMVAGLQWAVNLLSQRGIGLQNGLTITTGATAHILAEPGAEATVRYGEDGEFGQIQLTIVASNTDSCA